jgi:hypothetical protein
MAKTKTKKIIHAGAMVVEAVYPRVSRADTGRVRAAKQKASSEAQRRMNNIYSYQKLELMLAANFIPGDLVITLTSDDRHLPKERAQAAAQLKYFRGQLGRLRRDNGQELRMIWSTEHKHGEGRWHHHIVVNATGEDFEDIRRLWIYGDNIEIQRLRVDGEKSYASLARYMAKEERERLGLRSWSYTRNCRKPEVETFPVEADTQLQAPKGSTVLEEHSQRTEYSSYKIIKYLAPGWERRGRVRARRRGRK